MNGRPKGETTLSTDFEPIFPNNRAKTTCSVDGRAQIELDKLE